MSAGSTLEQEFEALISTEDYRVTVWSGDDSIKIELLYMPKLVIRGEGSFSYIANGKIAERWFQGRHKWKKAKKWTQIEIAGHREFVTAVNQV